MRKLWNRRKNYKGQGKGGVFTLFGVCLLIYFSYHLIFGQRSLLSLSAMNAEKLALQNEYDEVITSRDMLYAKVVRLRPQSVDADMLQERMGKMLGFYDEGAVVLLRDKNSL